MRFNRASLSAIIGRGDSPSTSDHRRQCLLGEKNGRRRVRKSRDAPGKTTKNLKLGHRKGGIKIDLLDEMGRPVLKKRFNKEGAKKGT